VEVISESNIPKRVPYGGIHAEATLKQQIRVHLHPNTKIGLQAK
jgi:hypothetical protein